MNLKKIITLILIVFIIFSSAAALFADGGSAQRDEDSGLNTFLSVINAWGTFLARITGSYDSLDHISRFSELARAWHDFVEADGFSPMSFFRMILGIFGISVFSAPDAPNVPSGGTGESYTL